MLIFFLRIYIVFSILLLVGCANKDSALIYFTGDVLLDRGVREQIDVKGVDHLFDGFRDDFHSADFVIGNLECPITSRHSPVHKRFVFRAEPEWTASLKTNGFTHLVLANNHTYDQGRTGIEETVSHLNTYGLIALGAGYNQRNACEPVILQKGALRIALFSSVMLPLENWNFFPDSFGICQATAEELATSIKDYRSREKPDAVIVILHWGAEFRKDATIDQKHEASILMNSGADLIVGHHPHVVEKWEYNSKTVYMSLGNFIFDQRMPDASKGLVLKVEVSKSGLNVNEIECEIKDCVPRHI